MAEKRVERRLAGGPCYRGLVLNFPLSSLKPNPREVLVQEVARADFPPAHDRAVRNDPVPPQGDELECLLVEGPRQ